MPAHLVEPLESRCLLSADPSVVATPVIDTPAIARMRLALGDPPTTLEAARHAAKLDRSRLQKPKTATTDNPSTSTTQPVLPANQPLPATQPVSAPNSTGSIPLSVICTPPSVADIPATPLVRPGGGFTAPTPQPAAIGAGFGVTDKAIARFDVVPYQTFNTTFYPGVVAFHSNGIAKVSFSANGGAWTDVPQMTPNPQTGVTEYVAKLDPSLFADGPVEIRAIAYPVQGTPRVLDPLFLNANAGGTLPALSRYVSPTGSDTTGDGTPAKPFATLVKAAWDIQQFSPSHTADGGTIYLAAGDYNYGTANWPTIPTSSTRWVTITPAPGVAQSAVRLVSSSAGGMRTGLVHVLGLTVAPTTTSVFVSPTPVNANLWIDHCTLIGPGRTVDMPWTGGFAHQYATDDDISNLRDGLVAEIQRNVNVHDIGSDAFSESPLVVNCTASNIDATGTTFHPDVVQYYGLTDNAIVYGLTATQNIKAQGLFIRTAAGVASNIAWVNCNVNNQNPTPQYGIVFQDCSATTNLFVANSNFVGPSVFQDKFSATDVVITNTTFSRPPPQAPGVTYN